MTFMTCWVLDHRGQITHIHISNLCYHWFSVFGIIIIRTNACLLLIIFFKEILAKLNENKNCYLRNVFVMSFVKWCPFCRSLIMFVEEIMSNCVTIFAIRTGLSHENTLLFILWTSDAMFPVSLLIDHAPKFCSFTGIGRSDKLFITRFVRVAMNEMQLITGNCAFQRIYYNDHHRCDIDN